MMALRDERAIINMNQSAAYLDSNFYDEDDVISNMIDEFLRDFDNLERTLKIKKNE